MGRRARGGVGRGDGLFLPDAKSKSDRIRPWNSSSLPLHRRWLGSLSTTQSISSHLAYLYLETRPPIYLSPLSPPLPPSALPSTPMNSTAHSQHLIDSSRRVLEQVCLSLPLSASLCVLIFDPPQATSPSLREILAAFKFSKGQDGDCQVLLAVLNAKSAEDQVFSFPPVLAKPQPITFSCAANRRHGESPHPSA